MFHDAKKLKMCKKYELKGRDIYYVTTTIFSNNINSDICTTKWHKKSLVASFF